MMLHRPRTTFRRRPSRRNNVCRSMNASASRPRNSVYPAGTTNIAPVFSRAATTVDQRTILRHHHQCRTARQATNATSHDTHSLGRTPPGASRHRRSRVRLRPHRRLVGSPSPRACSTSTRTRSRICAVREPLFTSLACRRTRSSKRRSVRSSLLNFLS